MRSRTLQLPVVAWLAVWFVWVVPTHDCRHWALEDGADGCCVSTVSTTRERGHGHDHDHDHDHAGCTHPHTHPPAGRERTPCDDHDREHDHGHCLIHLLSAGADAPADGDAVLIATLQPRRLGRPVDARVERSEFTRLYRGRAPPIT